MVFGNFRLSVLVIELLVILLGIVPNVIFYIKRHWQNQKIAFFNSVMRFVIFIEKVEFRSPC